MSDHPGFEYWKIDDLNPFPVGQIDLISSSPSGAMAFGSFEIPTALPEKKAVAERSIGIAGSSKLWFALECSQDQQGKITCEAVLRGRHVHWFKAHGETEGGELQEVRLSDADLTGSGFREKLVDHGHHCDTFQVTWFQSNNRVRCDLNVEHLPMTIRELLDMRERSKRDAELHPHIHIDPDYGPPPDNSKPHQPDLGGDET